MTPPRRWSFSLRMMFVGVGVLAAGLSWLQCQMRWADERFNFFDADRIEENNFVDYYSDTDLPPPLLFRLVNLCRSQQYCGIKEVVLGPNVTAEQIERARRLFPEAEVSLSKMPEPATQVDRP
jgi:hypothetical protein